MASAGPFLGKVEQEYRKFALRRLGSSPAQEWHIPVLANELPTFPAGPLIACGRPELGQSAPRARPRYLAWPARDGIGPVAFLPGRHYNCKPF